MQKVRTIGGSVSFRLHAVFPIAVAAVVYQCAVPAEAFKFLEKDPDGTTHINAPFVHVDVHHNADGQKDVSVDAPFTHVRNPAGGDNLQMSAPFTGLHTNPDGTRSVNAPFTKVRPTNHGRTQVSAPFTKVRPTNNGRTQVSAPFTRVRPTNDGRTQVSAPLTTVKPTTKSK